MSRDSAMVAGFLLYVLLLAIIAFAGALERSSPRTPHAVQAAWPRCFTQDDPPLLQGPLPKTARDPHRPTDGGVV